MYTEGRRPTDGGGAPSVPVPPAGMCQAVPPPPGSWALNPLAAKPQGVCPCWHFWMRLFKGVTTLGTLIPLEATPLHLPKLDVNGHTQWCTNGVLSGGIGIWFLSSQRNAQETLTSGVRSKMNLAAWFYPGSSLTQHVTLSKWTCLFPPPWVRHMEDNSTHLIFQASGRRNGSVVRSPHRPRARVLFPGLTRSGSQPPATLAPGKIWHHCPLEHTYA